MEATAEEFNRHPDFVGALKSYFFFTRRYIMVFYAVMAFAIVFAIIVSLVSIVLALFSLVTGGGLSDEFEFTLLVLIFICLGVQAIMAFTTIAYNLWQMLSQKKDLAEEFPETLKRMHLIHGYYSGTRNFIAKATTFIIPTVVVTLVLVVPLFAVIYVFYLAMGFEQVLPDLWRGIFVPDLVLVGLSVFLMNFNYYLRFQGLKK